MTARITLTTDSASSFLTWLDSADDHLLVGLMDHQGYRAVIEHSVTWNREISADDIAEAVKGHPSPMYGLAAVREHAEAIRSAIGYVEGNRGRIVAMVGHSLERVFASELAYPVELHCIVGYDWGIGLGGRVAINLNSRLYLDDHREIDYMLLHEATHVAYERAHGPMSPKEMKQPGGLRRLVQALVQNEGLAVYLPLQPRIQGKCLENQDYRFLFDPSALRKKTADLKALMHGLPENYPGDDAVGQTFDRLSGERLSYVVGCSAFVHLERVGGLPLVQQAALWHPEEFARSLLDMPT